MAAWGKGLNANSAPKFITDNTTGETGKQEYGNQIVFVTGKEGLPVAPGWARRVSKGQRVLWESLAALGSVGILEEPFPNPPDGFAYVTDVSGKYLIWKRTVYSDPVYLLVRTN